MSHTLGANIQMGRHGNGASGYHCSDLIIDEVRLYGTYLEPQAVQNLFEGNEPQPGLVSRKMAWMRPHVAKPALLSTSDRQHRINLPIAMRFDVRNSGDEVTDFWPLECCNLADCDEPTDWLEVTATFNAHGIRLGQDGQIGMGNPTTSNLLPAVGFTSVPGRFVTSPIDPGQMTTLAMGERGEIEYRPIEFGPPLQADDQLRCRPKGLESYHNLRTLTLTDPLMGLQILGIRSSGVSHR